MPDSDSTCWTVIRGAAAGRRADREEFARRYAPVIRAYLGARWRGSPMAAEIDDTAQEVFLECFRDGGALGRADPDRGPAFRAFLFGVVRNTALRAEHAAARKGLSLRSSLDPAAPGPTLSEVFDRAWAASLVRQAADRQAALALEAGPDAVRRVDLLKLRFHEGLPIREIARLWSEDAEILHRQFRRARREFRDSLLVVVREHNSGTPAEIEEECSRLIALFA